MRSGVQKRGGEGPRGSNERCSRARARSCEDLLAIEDVAQVLKEIAEAECTRLQAEEERTGEVGGEQWQRTQAAREEGSRGYF